MSGSITGQPTDPIFSIQMFWVSSGGLYLWDHICGIISVACYLWEYICGIMFVGLYLWDYTFGIISVRLYLWNYNCEIIFVEFYSLVSVFIGIGLTLCSTVLQNIIDISKQHPRVSFFYFQCTQWFEIWFHWMKTKCFERENNCACRLLSCEHFLMKL